MHSVDTSIQATPLTVCILLPATEIEECKKNVLSRDMGLGPALFRLYLAVQTAAIPPSCLNMNTAFRDCCFFAWIKQSVINLFQFQTLQFIEPCLPCITLVMWRYKVSSLHYSFISLNCFAGSLHQKTYTSHY